MISIYTLNLWDTGSLFLIIPELILFFSFVIWFFGGIKRTGKKQENIKLNWFSQNIACTPEELSCSVYLISFFVINYYETDTSGNKPTYNCFVDFICLGSNSTYSELLNLDFLPHS